MICKTCGTECGNANVCPICGCNPSIEFGATNSENISTQTTNNYAASSQPNANPNNIPQTTNANAAPLGMKWFKFIIYFQLWANAVLNFINAVLVGTGSMYGVAVENVYKVFPAMAGVDKFFGLLYIALAVFAIIVRFRLAKFKAGSPMLLHLCVGANIGCYVMYAFVASAATGIPFVDLMDASPVGLIILLISNIVYFKKRKELFIY